jgi:hypothetical protein
MQNMSYLVQEVLSAQRELELSSARHRMLMQAVDESPGTGGARRALAGGLVRLGLRLHPAAGEGLGAPQLSLAGTNGGHTQ